MMTSLKMEKRGKSLKKTHMKMSTLHIGKITQVTTSSKIKNKLTKKIPPSKMTAQNNDLR